MTERLPALLDGRTRVVAVTQASNTLGTRPDLRPVIDEAHQMCIRDRGKRIEGGDRAGVGGQYIPTVGDALHKPFYVVPIRYSLRNAPAIR